MTRFRNSVMQYGRQAWSLLKSSRAGKIHRFPGQGKGKSNTAGWCILFEDCRGGCFGDFSTGLHKVWQAKLDKPLTEDEQTAYRRNVEEAKKHVTEELQRQHSDAAKEATAIWENATRAKNDHPYLVQKNIQAHGMRLHKGALVIPVSTEGNVHSLQFIASNGDKRFLKGGRITGGRTHIGLAKDPKILCIAEGFSTAASVNEATGLTVVIAFNAKNLMPVAKAMRKKFPEVSLILCADNDMDTEGNPGVTEANKSARAVGAKLAIPEFGNQRPEGATDFNDLANYVGIHAVKQAINAAAKPTHNGDAERSDWPKLVLLDIPDLPCLDPECLPAWAGDYARAVAAYTETPLELAVGMILATCATACARRMKVSIKQGYSEPCNLWVVVALPPGNRKSVVHSTATKPLIEWECDQAAHMEEDIIRISSERTTMEARIKEIRNRSAREKDVNKANELKKEAADIEVELPEVPSVPRLWTSDSTPERLDTLLAENDECMSWLSSEGAVFDLLEGRYSKGIPNLDLVLKAHSANPERVDRGSRSPVVLHYPRLGFGLSPQPDVLNGLASKPGFRGRGLLGRFLYFLPCSPLGYRTLESSPVPDKVRDAYVKSIRAMLSWEPDIDEKDKIRPHVVRMSDDAYDVHHTFALAIEDKLKPGGELEHFKDWAGKAPGAAVRVAGVLHGIIHAHGKPWKTAITVDTMNAALDIIAVATKHSLVALDMMRADLTVAAARLVWEWVERNRLSHFTVREDFNAHRSTFPRVKNLRIALEVLEERGYIDIVEPSNDGPGRPPSPAVIVRLEIVESWK